MCDLEADRNVVGVRRDLDLAAGIGRARIVEPDFAGDILLVDGDGFVDIAYIVIAVAIDLEHIFARIQDLGVAGAVDRNNKPSRIRIGDVDCADKDVVADHGAVIDILFELHFDLSFLEPHRFDGEVAVGELERIVIVKSLVHERDLQRVRDSGGFLRGEIDIAVGDLEHKFLRCVVVGKFGLIVEVYAVRRADVRLCRAVGDDAVRDINAYLLRCDIDGTGVFGEGDDIVADRVFTLGDDDLCFADVAVGKVEHAVRVESCDQAVRVACNDGHAVLCRLNCVDLGRAVAVGSGTGSGHADGDGSRDDVDRTFVDRDVIVGGVACCKRIGQIYRLIIGTDVGGTGRCRGDGRRKSVRREHIGNGAVVSFDRIAFRREVFAVGLFDRVGGDGDFARIDDERDLELCQRHDVIYVLSAFHFTAILARFFGDKIVFVLAIIGEFKDRGVGTGIAGGDIRDISRSSFFCSDAGRDAFAGHIFGLLECEFSGGAVGISDGEFSPELSAGICDVDGNAAVLIEVGETDEIVVFVIDHDLLRDLCADDIDRTCGFGSRYRFQIFICRGVVAGDHRDIIVVHICVGCIAFQRIDVQAYAVQLGTYIDLSIVGDFAVDEDVQQPLSVLVLVVIAEDLTFGDSDAFVVGDLTVFHRHIVLFDVLQLQRERRPFDFEGLHRFVADDVVGHELLAARFGSDCERIGAGVARRRCGVAGLVDIEDLERILVVITLFVGDDAYDIADRCRAMLFAVVGDRAEVAVEGDGQRLGRDLVGKGVLGTLGDVVVVEHSGIRRMHRLIRSDILAYCLRCLALEIGDLVSGFDLAGSVVVAVVDQSEGYLVHFEHTGIGRFFNKADLWLFTIFILCFFGPCKRKHKFLSLDRNIKLNRYVVEVFVAGRRYRYGILSGVKHIPTGTIGRFCDCDTKLLSKIFVFRIIWVFRLEVVACAECLIELIKRSYGVGRRTISELIDVIIGAYKLELRLCYGKLLPHYFCFAVDEFRICAGDGFLLGREDVVVGNDHHAHKIVPHVNDARRTAFKRLEGCCGVVAQIIGFGDHLALVCGFGQIEDFNGGALGRSVVSPARLVIECELYRARSNGEFDFCQFIDVCDGIVGVLRKV